MLASPEYSVQSRTLPCLYASARNRFSILNHSRRAWINVMKLLTMISQHIMNCISPCVEDTEAISTTIMSSKKQQLT